MKIIDNKGKIFGKVSIIDILIAFCLIFIAVVFVLKISGNIKIPTPTKQNVEYTTQIKAYNLFKTDKEPFKVGEKLYSSSGDVIGEIIAIDKQQGYSNEKLQDGTFIKFKNDEYIDYYLTVKGVGSYTDKGYKAEGKFILCPSDTITVSSGMYYGSAVVLSVEKTA